MKRQPTPTQALLARLAGGAALLLTALLLLGACQSKGDSPPEAIDDALARLTQAPGLTLEAPAQATPGAGDAAAEATQTVAAFMESLQAQGDLPDLPTEVPGSNQVVDSDAAFRAAKATADATAGIPDVTGLVLSMPRLATFTPAPRAAEPEGELLYLRNGSFYRASAAGGDTQPIEPENPMPPVWSPPDDPGRAWQSPDGARVAFFAGADAALWVMDADGGGNRAVSADNLPSELHPATVSGAGEQSVRLRPGKDYTLVHLPEAEEPLAVLIDDNSRHIRGQGRLRFVHAMAGEKDRDLVVYIQGVPFGAPMGYGRSSGALGIATGPVQVELRDRDKALVATLPPFPVADHELKTVFLTGSGGAVNAVPVAYEPADPPGGFAHVRVFNAGPAPIDVTLDGNNPIAKGLAPGTIGIYGRAQATLGEKEREMAQMGIYGLISQEDPVAWSPDGRNLAFLGAGDGQMDLYLSDLEGPARRLTQDELRQLNPIWSPDGRRLAWLAEDELSGVYGIYVADLAGGPARAIDLAPLRQAAGQAPTAKIAFPDDPEWIDGNRLAIYPRSDQLSLGIWAADAASGRLSPVTREPVEQVHWSPQAQAWAYSADETAGRLAVQGLTGASRPLVASGGYWPLWSPDGGRISYVEGNRLQAEGWRLHVVEADGSNDRALTPPWPLMQVSPPIPGPNAKRWWLDGGETLLFTRVGRDYGAAERAGLGARQEAGPDLENLYRVSVEGGSEPRAITDLTQVFYLGEVAPSPSEETLGFEGLWYASRTQQLWTVPAQGGKSQQIDGPVRWFAWLP